MLWAVLLCLMRLCAGILVEQWAKQDGTSAVDILLAISADDQGNLFATGYSRSSFDGHIHVGGSDVIVRKYSSDGTKLWTKQEGSTGDDMGRGGMKCFLSEETRTKELTHVFCSGN